MKYGNIPADVYVVDQFYLRLCCLAWAAQVRVYATKLTGSLAAVSWDVYPTFKGCPWWALRVEER